MRRVLLAALVLAVTLQPFAVAPAEAAAEDTIVRTSTLSLTPEQPGEVDVRVSFDVPSNVVSLTTSVPADATVLSTTGFEANPDGTYTWDGEGADPQLTMAMPANRTGVGLRGEEASSGYEFVDAGDWAIVSPPPMSTSWSYRGNAPTFESEVRTDGPGYAGTRMVYLGPATTHERIAHGQTFTLVVPDSATLEPTPEAVLDSLEAASLSLRVGERDPSVTVIAAPTAVDWAAGGLAADEDAWVRADRPLADPNNVWLHEYVHTRMDVQTTADARWVVEGAPEYYASLLTLEQGLIDFAEFRDHLRLGAREPYASSVLSRPDTWATGANYLKGALVFGTVDRQLRVATDSAYSGADLVARLNGADERVDHATLRRTVADLGGKSTADALDRYATTTDAPDAWTRSEHAEAFSQLPPRMVVGENPTYSVTGPYRNVSATTVPTVVTGETLGVTVTVTNQGDVAGEYDVQLLVDDTVADSAAGRLEAGESRDLTFQTNFSTTGTHTIQVGESVTEVAVERPAEPRVVDLSVDRPTVTAGESVELTMTIENPASKPAAGTVPVVVDGTEVASWTGNLGVEERLVVTRMVSLSEPGTHTIEVGDRQVTVTVERAGDEPPAPVSTPGFGVLAVLGAFGVVAAFLVRRHS